MSPTVQAIAICCDPSQQVITILIHGVSADAFFGIASDTVVSNTNIARSFFIFTPGHTFQDAASLQVVHVLF